MSKATKKEAFNFWSFIPLLYIFGIFNPGNLNFVFSGAHFSISNWKIINLLAIYFFISGIAYYFVKGENRYPWLKSIHFTSSFIAIMLILSRRGLEYCMDNVNPFISNILLVIASIMFLIGLISFVYYIRHYIIQNNDENIDYL